MRYTCSVQILIKGQPQHIEPFIAYLATKKEILEYKVLNDENIAKGFVNLSGSLKESAYTDLHDDDQLVALTKDLAVEMYTQIANDNSVPGIVAGYDEHVILRDGFRMLYTSYDTKSYFTEDFVQTGKPNTVDAFNQFANSNITEDEFENDSYVKHGGYDTDDEKGLKFTI